MKKFFKVFLFSASAAFLLSLSGGCKSPFPVTEELGPKTDLSKIDYKVLKYNASGKSEGSRVLFITNPPSYAEAVNSLYSTAGISPSDKYSLINVREEQLVKDYFFWSFPTIILRADIVEIQNAARQ